MYTYKSNSTDVTTGIKILSPDTVRVRMTTDGDFKETLMTKYGILDDYGDLKPDSDTEQKSGFEIDKGDVRIVFSEKNNSFTFHGPKHSLAVKASGYDGNEYNGSGFELVISMTEDERLFGLGDESRKNIARRNTVATMSMQNVTSYGPIPYLMSTNGWGILVNCTYTHSYDIGVSDKNKIIINSKRGFVDFYLFIPKTHKLTDILDAYTKVSGKPIMLPKYAYGYSFVLNEQTNAREMLLDCREFRKEGIPVDTVGLEPQWMENNYDKSTEKKWSEDRFYLPGWLSQDQCGPETFLYSLREMGFKLSLWLCNDYDLLWEEERQIGEKDPGDSKKKYSFDGASIRDEHFSSPEYSDNVTKRDEPWFKHLEKFVNNGASAFKLDGAFQCNEHPDRLWAGKYFDSEVHNIYPVIYVKQMMQGYREFTKGRRAFVYTPCVYTGTQRYAASWAGDTGGGEDTVVAMLNYGLSGQVNVTCDMDVTLKERIHYGFFCPWTQQLTWRTWNYPWFMRKELSDMIKYYANLRLSLFPYIYSMAQVSSKTGIPIARAISLMYPDVPEYDMIKNEYMFGDSFLVSVFDMNITFPKGNWVDFFTKKKYKGNSKIKYDIPEGRGGGLFVKSGSIIPRIPSQSFLCEKEPDRYLLEVYPGDDAIFKLVEDDGMTYDYLDGKVAETIFKISNTKRNSFDFSINKRNGKFDGREIHDDKYYITSSEPKIFGIGELVPIDVDIISDKIITVFLKDKKIDTNKIDGGYRFTIPADLHKKSDLVFNVKIN